MSKTDTNTLLLGAALGALGVSGAAFIFKHCCKSRCGGGWKGCGQGGCKSGCCKSSCGSKGDSAHPFTMVEEKGEFDLVYYPVRGRAEVARLIFEETGTPFRNTATGDEDLKGNLKPSGDLAFGQVPLLKHGSFKLVQSNAISRYLGRHFNLYGKNSRERAQIDVVIDGVEDFRVKLNKLVYVDKYSDEARPKYVNEVLKLWLGYFETLLLKNSGGHGFFVGDNLSIGDFAVYEILDVHNFHFPDSLSSFPLLKQFHARIESRPNIAAYLKSGRRVPLKRPNS